MAYDVIGDVHGCAAKLRILLAHLGYRESDGVYRHPDRTAVTERTACVDFSAITAEGRLVAYRWTGESAITAQNYLPHATEVHREGCHP